jgi:filamentous hemagglutinin family protein
MPLDIPDTQKTMSFKGRGWRGQQGVYRAIALGFGLFGAGPGHLGLALGQVIPDATLPENSIVAPGCTTCLIFGGTTRGANLFHSFREFSIPTGGLAVFNNALSVQNILVRVTGANRSSIDGLLTANGSANLFLLNPNGITFGPNAQLYLGGSFLATTGSRFKFADGSEFSATNPQALSLLAVNVPVGLQMGGTRPPGDLQVQGASLAVPTGKTLALVGGDVTILGSSSPLSTGLIAGGFPYVVVNGSPVPTTPGGRVELWSVQQGEVAIAQPHSELVLSRAGSPIAFGTLRLAQKASVNAAGTGGGAIQIQTGVLSFSEGAYLSSVTTADQPGRSIEVNASESFEINGRGGYREKLGQFSGVVASQDFFESGLYAISFGTGAAGNITINTPSFNAQNGSYVVTSTLTGGGGAVTVNAPGSVYLSEALIAITTGVRNSPNLPIETIPGAGSRLTINTGTLRLEKSSFLSTISLSAGRGGNLTVNATDAIDLSSARPVIAEFYASEPTAGGLISSSAVQGDAGNITISTRRLRVRDGASILAGSITQQLAGVLTIQASESVEVFGSTPDGFSPSQITAGAYSGTVGNGGNLNIATGRLSVRDGGVVSVQARGFGLAGTLKIAATTIALDTQGQINATTGSGTGGNLDVQANLLSLRRGSRINTDAGDSNGGNIRIQTGFIVASPIENSDITANALTTGNGGRVNITAQGIYGLQFRPQLTPLSDITASSQFGINGTVTLDIPNLDPSRGTIELPVNLTDSAQQITPACSQQQRDHSFVVTGRGGLSADPSEVLNGTLVWTEGGAGRGRIEGSGIRGAREPQGIEARGAIVEMTGWVRNGDGSMELVTRDDRPNRQSIEQRGAICQPDNQAQKRQKS